MNSKKIIALVVICVFAMSSLAFAAKGGAKVSAPKAAPSMSTQQKTPAASTTKEYKPSQDAKSIDKNAPAAATAKSPAAATSSSSPWGGMMRNIGLFAGGMFLGGMLSHLFGMGSAGMFSDIMGLLLNVVMIGVVIMLARMLWNKFKGRSNQSANPYQSQSQPSAPMQASRREEIIDVTPQVRGNDYNSKTKADEYRSR